MKLLISVVVEADVLCSTAIITVFAVKYTSTFINIVRNIEQNRRYWKILSVQKMLDFSPASLNKLKRNNQRIEIY